MKAFYCSGCGSLAFFDNVKCLTCGRALGFLPDEGEVRALEAAQNDTVRAANSGAKGWLYRRCANATKHHICNWMIPAEDANPFCASCRLNQVIPDLEAPPNLERWHRLEMAKRRVIYTLLKFKLPMEGAGERPPLRFSFLGDAPGQQPVRTGHANGLIVINIAEADDDDRERRRVSLHEPYRTLVGHFRHEIAHYYWDRLIAGSQWLERCRALFGDDTKDYAAALQTYYEQGPPNDWQARHVSAYASAHPWEDWAETWANCFHIVDTLETSASFGLVLNPAHPSAKTMTSNPAEVCRPEASFDAMLQQWFPLVYALNALNRGMGLHDLYPFALSNPAIEKLRFINDVLRAGGNLQGPPP